MDMSQEIEGPEAQPVSNNTETTEVSEPRKHMPPVESRFMFVDIAALRAKQLRRGARPRVEPLDRQDSNVKLDQGTEKIERIAMREIEEGLIVYELPSLEPKTEDTTAKG
jgi:DNA-directed RNA polymerase omega subunit